VTHKVLLPGGSTLERYIARLRSRVEEQLWRSLSAAVSAANSRKSWKICWSSQPVAELRHWIACAPGR